MKIRVKKSNKQSGSYRLYLPKHIGELLEGDADCLPNALTVTLIKPNTPLELVKKSLEIVLQDVELRLEHERTNAADS